MPLLFTNLKLLKNAGQLLQKYCTSKNVGSFVHSKLGPVVMNFEQTTISLIDSHLLILGGRVLNFPWFKHNGFLKTMYEYQFIPVVHRYMFPLYFRYLRGITWNFTKIFYLLLFSVYNQHYSPCFNEIVNFLLV